MTQKFTRIDFVSLPVGSEAIPPKGSEYHRAIHLPDPDHDGDPWVLLRGEGALTVADRVPTQYLVTAGFAPAERLGMVFESAGPEPDTEDIRTLVSVEFPIHTGAYAWALASQLPSLVSDGEVLRTLLTRGDRSVEDLLEDRGDVDELATCHPAGKGLHPADER